MNPKWNGQFSCFDLVAKTSGRSRSVVQVRDIEIGGNDFVVMAGPCAVESESQLMQTAEAVAGAGARILRGGAYKPRSSPYAFQGLGVEGLKILRKAREATGLAIVTEVMSEEDVDLIAEYADIMQVGTRSMENYALLDALGRCGRPVLLKRGMTATLEDLLHSAQVIAVAGNLQIILCERGIRTFETATRNTLDIAAVPVLKTVSHLPVIVDPSHAAGVRALVPVFSRAAAVVGADGLIVEVHPCPEQALSDGNQSLTFGEFCRMMKDLQPYLDLERRGSATASATPRRRGSGLVASRFILILAIASGLLALCVLGLTRNTVKASASADPPSFLYTSAKQYEPLAWLHGEDRFHSGATILVREPAASAPWFLVLPPLRCGGFIRWTTRALRREVEIPRPVADLGDSACRGRATPHHDRLRRLREALLPSRRSRGLCAPQVQADS